jgi:RNA polymerase sigma-70 factor (ECF subfamily)
MSVATTTFLAAPRSTPVDARVRAAIVAHYEAVWRFLLRMGVEESHVEDAAQNVFVVLARRRGEIAPAVVKAFLFGTALRVASDFRRHRDRRVEIVDIGDVVEQAHPSPDAEHQLAQNELRRFLDRVLDALSPDLRAVFVLTELEEMTMAEIASALSIPAGTVASRLRRARELFAITAHELRPELEKGVAP